MNDTLSNSSADVQLRLAIKNIPENFSNDQLFEVLNKNFENLIKDTSVVKLEHKFNTKNNKICFLTVESLDIRKKLFSFVNTFELVDPKGFKQKLIIVDCLYQSKPKSTKDIIENSIHHINHFQKFKEYLSEGKIIEFKNEESKLLDGIFEGVEETVIKASEKKESQSGVNNNKKLTKVILTKKIPSNSATEFSDRAFTEKLSAPQTELSQKLFSIESNIEIISTQRNEDSNYIKNGKTKNSYRTNQKTKNYFQDNSYNQDNNYYNQGYTKNEYYNQNYDNDYNEGGYNNKGYDNYHNKSYNNYSYKNNYKKGGGYK